MIVVIIFFLMYHSDIHWLEHKVEELKHKKRIKDHTFLETLIYSFCISNEGNWNTKFSLL